MSYCPNLAELLYAICRKPGVKICRSRDVYSGCSVLVYMRNDLIRLQCVDDRSIVHDFNKQRVERILAAFHTISFGAKSSQPNFAELIEMFSQSTDDITVHDEILRDAKEQALIKMDRLAKEGADKKNADASIAALLFTICQKPDIQICRSPGNGGGIIALVQNDAIKLECHNDDGVMADPDHQKIERINVQFYECFFNLDASYAKFEELVAVLKTVTKDSVVFSKVLDNIFKSAVSALTELSK